MELPTDVKRVTRTIANIPVLVAQPYTTGHVLTEAEAAMLNQTFAENISNNTRAKAEVTEGEGDAKKTRTLDPKLEADVATFQAIVDKYVADYTPGVRAGGGGGTRTLDPIEKEMRAIAEQQLKDLLATKGLKQKDVAFAELRDKIIAAHGDALRKKATKIVSDRTRAAANSDDILATIASGLPGLAEDAGEGDASGDNNGNGSESEEPEA